MTRLAYALSQATGADIAAEGLKTVIMFCAVGMTVSLMVISYGIDLSWGFF